MITAPRPGGDEYAASFAGYVSRIVEDEVIVAVLATQLDQVLARLSRVSEARGDYRYAPRKWSVAPPPRSPGGALCRMTSR